MGSPRQYYSGTNCAFAGDIWTETPGAILVYACIKINGEVAAYYAGGGDEWAKAVVCDSTHFADGTSIAPTLEALATFGDYAGYGNPLMPVKNRGRVYGNNTFPGGLGTAEMNDVATDLAGIKKTPLASDQSYKADILATIPAGQVFFIYTHASNSVIEDCVADGTGRRRGDNVQAERIPYNGLSLSGF